MTAFLAIATDVPKRLQRGWIAWILLVLMALIIAFFAGALGRGDDGGTAYMTFFGQDTRQPGVPSTIEGAVQEWVSGVFGYFFACYVGVFAGLVFLADAVTSAFQPGSAEINLPKPLHRGTIVLARHAGAVLAAALFATLLVGGGMLVAWMRTGVLAWKTLYYVPGSVLLFALLHAVGSIAGVAIKNAFFTAFFSVSAWLASGLARAPEWLSWDQMPDTFLGRVAKVASWIHRGIPRANDIPSFVRGVIEHKPLDPLWKADDIELSANLLIWWVLALVLAILLVRRRDF